MSRRWFGGRTDDVTAVEIPEQREPEVELRVKLDRLIAKWQREVDQYPDTDRGFTAATAVSLCAQQLAKLLKATP